MWTRYYRTCTLSLALSVFGTAVGRGDEGKFFGAESATGITRELESIRRAALVEARSRFATEYAACGDNWATCWESTSPAGESQKAFTFVKQPEFRVFLNPHNAADEANGVRARATVTVFPTASRMFIVGQGWQSLWRAWPRDIDLKHYTMWLSSGGTWTVDDRDDLDAGMTKIGGRNQRRSAPDCDALPDPRVQPGR